MADILIYGKLKSASGGKLLHYSSIEGAPEILRTSGDSNTGVMSQAATMDAIRQSIKEFAPFHFSGKATRSEIDSSGKVIKLYKEDEFSLKFSTSEGDQTSIPGTDGETGVLGVLKAPEGYKFTVNGNVAPNVEFYKINDYTIKCIFYDDDGGFVSENLNELDGVSIQNINFSVEEDFEIYRKNITVSIIPQRGDVWQLNDREYVWNGDEWVELGFNLTVDLKDVYTKTDSDRIFATKNELNNQISSITTDSIGALKKVTSSGYGRVYGITSNGLQITRDCRDAAVAESLPIRDSDGTFQIGEPKSNTHPATKKYVDGAISAALGAAEAALAEV